MHEKSSNPLGLPPTTWITLVIALVGIFALKQSPFQDSRPTDPWVPAYNHSPSLEEDVEARLWQDPLAAVQTARNAQDKADAKPAAEILKSNEGATPRGAASDIKSAGRAYNMAGAKTAVAAAGPCIGPADPSAPGPEQILDVHTARHLCRSVSAHVNSSVSDVLAMGVIVPGSPYAADIENRRRMRYAVLAGLYRSGYMPVNNEHVGYIRLDEFYEDPVHADDVAAFEWFHSDLTSGKQPSRVLLLWLDQEGFRERPIHQLTRIINAISPPSVPTVLLGPADSEGLRAIAKEFVVPGASPVSGARRIAIYSSRATAADEDIVRGIAPSLATQFQSAEANVRLYRSVANAKDVAGAVRNELRDRHVKPGEIALIAERDSLYARSIGAYFGGCADPPRSDPTSAPDDADSHPLCLTYLKGLDGVGPPPPKQTTASSGANANETKASGRQSAPGAAPDASTGPRQLDYLRRIGSALVALQGASQICDSTPRAPARCPPRYIKAIGVLSTDIYDKLLILQELRPSFPDVIFFTFDLDARFTDQANLQWTRQLLIGSSLGLALRSEIQADIPTFRDGFQSTIFYSTLLALHRANAAPPDNDAANALPDNAGLQWTSQPQVFEIGRKRPLDLIFDADASRPCQFDGLCPSLSETRSSVFSRAVTQSSVSWVILLVPAIAWILLRAALGKPAMRRSFGVSWVNPTTLAVALAVLGVAAIQIPSLWHFVWNTLTGNQRHMPASIADGAGRWGQELLEASLVPLVLMLLLRGQRKLNANAEKMRIEFTLSRKYHSLIQRYASRARRWPLRRRIREWAYLPVGHLSNDDDPIPVLAGTSPLESLIARYLFRGVWKKRWVRVIAATVAFTLALKILEGFGFSLFAGLPSPFAQVQKHGAEGLISFCAFLFMQVLIFWVIDAILLTRAFMLNVARDEPHWPEVSLAKVQADLGLPADLAPTWLDLQLIARRTSWVGGFIWYPSLVIAGMFAATFTVQYGQYRFENNPITLFASVGLIVTAVVLLRQGAESWRSELLRRLNNRRLAQLVAVPPNKDAVDQLQVLIDLVTRLHDGAFAPYSEQPMIKAVLLPAITFAATAGLPFLHPG